MPKNPLLDYSEKLAVQCENLCKAAPICFPNSKSREKNALKLKVGSNCFSAPVISTNRSSKQIATFAAGSKECWPLPALPLKSKYDLNKLTRASVSVEARVFIQNLTFSHFFDTLISRHNSIMLFFTGVYFCLSAKMHTPVQHSREGKRNCVAAIGVVHFSVRSFGCALF